MIISNHPTKYLSIWSFKFVSYRFPLSRYKICDDISRISVEKRDCTLEGGSQLSSSRGWEGGRCLIHRIVAILRHIEAPNRSVSRWQGAKSQWPPGGTRHSTREVLSGFSGAFKCFRSCLECRKRLSETEAETF